MSRTLELGPPGRVVRVRPSTSIARLSTVASGRVATDDDFSARVKRVGGERALAMAAVPPWQVGFASASVSGDLTST